MKRKAVDIKDIFFRFESIWRFCCCFCSSGRFISLLYHTHACFHLTSSDWNTNPNRSSKIHTYILFTFHSLTVLIRFIKKYCRLKSLISIQRNNSMRTLSRALSTNFSADVILFSSMKYHLSSVFIKSSVIFS